MTFYYWLYIKFYTLSIKMNDGEEYPNAYSCMALTLVFIVNLFNFVVLFDLFVGDGVLSALQNNLHFIVLALTVITFFIQYFYFSYRERYKEILEKAGYNSHEESYKGGLIFAFCSIAILIFMLVIG